MVHMQTMYDLSRLTIESTLANQLNVVVIVRAPERTARPPSWQSAERSLAMTAGAATSKGRQAHAF